MTFAGIGCWRGGGSSDTIRLHLHCLSLPNYFPSLFFGFQEMIGKNIINDSFLKAEIKSSVENKKHQIFFGCGVIPWFWFQGKGNDDVVPLKCFFLKQIFFFYFNSNFFLNKRKNSAILVTLMAAHNWGLTKSCIDKNWKWEDWIEKTES